jgi:signal transduction histidine kinase
LPQAFIGLLGALLTFVALMCVPSVAALLGVQRGTAITVAIGWLACSAAAMTAYHLTGLSRLYLFLDAVESLAVQGGVCLLLYRSGSALSIFWLPYLGQVQLLAAVGFSAQNLAVTASGPAALVLTFWLKGDLASALVSFLASVLGMYVYYILARLYSSLESALAREAELKNSLARLRVAEERNRIARDLHDGVAGELTALSWRLRQLAPATMMADTLETEVGRIEERLRGAIGSLRHVVLDLRQEGRTWAETIAALRQRCLDLCGSRELVFSVFGSPTGPVEQAVAEDIDYIVSELVRNASTHAAPRRIEVQIRFGDRVELSVSDDGMGLPPDYASRSVGGLANLRTRLERLGGGLELRPQKPGTHMAVRLPALSHGHGMVTPGRGD